MLLDTFVLLQILLDMPRPFGFILFAIILIIALYVEIRIYGSIWGKNGCWSLDHYRKTKKDSKWKYHILLTFSPAVTSEFACFSKSASGAYSFLHMECMFATSSTSNVGFFTAHFRCCSFCHIKLLLYGDT